jgi:hypothetical protein
VPVIVRIDRHRRLVLRLTSPLQIVITDVQTILIDLGVAAPLQSAFVVAWKEVRLPSNARRATLRFRAQRQVEQSRYVCPQLRWHLCDVQSSTTGRR